LVAKLTQSHVEPEAPKSLHLHRKDHNRRAIFS
jgi:hypothetical protein